MKTRFNSLSKQQCGLVHSWWDIFTGSDNWADSRAHWLFLVIYEVFTCYILKAGKTKLAVAGYNWWKLWCKTSSTSTRRSPWRQRRVQSRREEANSGLQLDGLHNHRCYMCISNCPLISLFPLLIPKQRSYFCSARIFAYHHMPQHDSTHIELH